MLDVDIPQLLRVVQSAAAEASRDDVLAGVERLCVLSDIPSSTWSTGVWRFGVLVYESSCEFPGCD